MINWDFFQRITKNWIDKQKISLQSQLLVFYDESRVFPHPLAVFRPYLHFVNQLSFSRGDKCNLSLWRDGFILCCYGIILWKSCSVLLFVRLIAQPQTQPTRLLLRLLRVPKNRGYISISYFLHYRAAAAVVKFPRLRNYSRWRMILAKEQLYTMTKLCCGYGFFYY